MTKESVYINVQGYPFGDGPRRDGSLDGPHTHMRGEGIWPLNVALNMARHGHDVTILAYTWGDTNKYPLPKNIRLQSEFQGECDIFIDSGWEDEYAPQRYRYIKARHYIHGWHGDPAASTFLKYSTEHNLKNHYIGGMSRAYKYYCDKYPLSLYMPIPIVEKIKTVPNTNSKKMIWANKGAFHLGYYKYSEKILEFMERHLDYEYTILFYADIIERTTNEIKRPDIIKRFEKLPYTNLLEPYYGLTRDKFMEELDSSIFLLDNGHPSMHPQSIEAVCQGCIPFIWNVGEHQHHFQTEDYKSIPKKFGMEIDIEKEGMNIIDNLLDNKDLYIDYYNALKETVTDHEYDNAYTIMMNGIYNKEY